MKDQLDHAKETLGRIAAVFLILWFIAAVTNIMGKYEYEVEFLQLAVGFYLLSRVPTAFRKRYTAGKKVQKFFTNVGWPLIGLWIAFKIFRWIDWFGAMDIGIEIDYLLVTGIIFLLIGYAAKSLRYKAGYWAARSVLFAIGFVSIFFWILIRVFDIFPHYADIALVTCVVAIGLGYILGGLKRPPDFFVEIEEEEEFELEVSDDVYVTEDDTTITGEKTQVKLKKGSLFIPVTAKKEIGGIYFGEGSYQLDAKVKTYSEVYRGVTLVSGGKWESVKKDQKMKIADEQAFDDIGLKREEVLEIARLQVKGKLTDELRKKLKNVQVNLPFIKVRETPHGEYVKVGPLEFTDTGGEEHVRIGPWEYSESKHRSRFIKDGLLIQIRSKDEDITIITNGKTIMTKGDMHIIVDGKVTVKGEDISLSMDEHTKLMRSGKLKLICKEDKRILHSDGFRLTVGETTGRIRKNGKSRVIKDENTLAEIRTEIDAVADELIKEILDQKELRELDALIKRFEQEL